VGRRDRLLRRSVDSDDSETRRRGYRRIRNTLRFLLANTADFDVTRHAVPLGDL
jgi:isoleucyl-tRNA synthetase